MVVHWGAKEKKLSMYPMSTHSAEWLSILDTWTCLLKIRFSTTVNMLRVPHVPYSPHVELFAIPLLDW